MGFVMMPERDVPDSSTIGRRLEPWHAVARG
jgi:hypothetical protein